MLIARLLITLVLSVASSTAITSATGCGSAGIWGNDCTVENTGTEVDVGGTTHTGGGSGDGSASAGDGTTGSDLDSDDSLLAAPVCTTALCRGGYSAVRIPEATMEDLAAFRPTVPSVASEPAGIGLAGMPTNFLTAADPHTVTGELFGYDVVVRFTPVAYVFDHGDGTSQRGATPGSSWRGLAQADFTPTATSHAYSERGTYGATASVEYTAQVDFGGGWRAVPGILTLTSAGYEVRIVAASTALVARTCLEDPTGPGC